MKRVAVIVFLFAILLFPTLSDAANGDIAGKYYATDIVTYMYYAPITSYNIGGKTCIDAEILNWHYGFDVYWYADKRLLDITDKGGRFVSLQSMSGEILENADAKPGTVIGNYYKTDIITLLNGKKIESYNIGGRTVICAEAMADFGYNVDWDSENRTLTISKQMDFYKYTTDYGTIKSMRNFRLRRENNVFFDRGVILTKGNEKFILNTPSNKIYVSPGGPTYIKLSEFESVLGGQCSLKESISTATSEWVNGITDSYDYYTYEMNFNYDPNVTVDISEYDESLMSNMSRDEGMREFYSIEEMNFIVNGKNAEIKNCYGGKIFSDNLIVIDGEFYIPAYNLAVYLGYDFAY